MNSYGESGVMNMSMRGMDCVSDGSIRDLLTWGVSFDGAPWIDS